MDSFIENERGNAPKSKENIAKRRRVALANSRKRHNAKNNSTRIRRTDSAYLESEDNDY